MVEQVDETLPTWKQLQSVVNPRMLSNTPKPQEVASMKKKSLKPNKIVTTNVAFFLHFFASPYFSSFSGDRLSGGADGGG